MIIQGDGAAIGAFSSAVLGIVRPTLEVILSEAPAALIRAHDPETGLAPIKLP